jgi:hypothetical protein
MGEEAGCLDELVGINGLSLGCYFPVRKAFGISTRVLLEAVAAGSDRVNSSVD